MASGLKSSTGPRSNSPVVDARRDFASRNGLISLDHALDILLDAAPRPASEVIALERAAGRTLAAPVKALRDRPARTLSAMDGYAVQGLDPPQLGQSFQIVGAAYPGAPFGRRVDGGEAVRVTTGAEVPLGADRVIIDEDVDVAGRMILVTSDPGGKPHLRSKGSDFCRGQCLVPSGVRLTSTTLMAAAACETWTVTVTRRPRVALVTTGDELACSGGPIGDHQIPDSISIAIAAMVTAWGGDIVCRDRSGDEAGSIVRAMGSHRDDADLIVIIGGASGSERDKSRAASLALGADMLFQGVALKPGKPAWAARRKSQLLVGLPGNPMAALVASRLLLAPIIAQMESGSADDAQCWRLAHAIECLGPGTDRDVILGANVSTEGVRILATQDSSSHSQLAELNALVRRAPGCGAAEIGSPLRYLAF